ncbi:hypothetical protein OROHE_008702 [Orobanche hederae]
MPPKASKSKEAKQLQKGQSLDAFLLISKLESDRMGNEITRLTTMKAIENLDPDHHCLEYLNNKLSDEI